MRRAGRLNIPPILAFVPVDSCKGHDFVPGIRFSWYLKLKLLYWCCSLRQVSLYQPSPVASEVRIRFDDLFNQQLMCPAAWVSDCERVPRNAHHKHWCKVFREQSDNAGVGIHRPFWNAQPGCLGRNWATPPSFQAAICERLVTVRRR